MKKSKKLVKIGNLADGGIQNVRNKTVSPDASRLLFSFSDFKLTPINIKNEFNNFYKNAEEYSQKITVFLGMALPLLATEDETIFKNITKSEKLHLHKLINKEDILEKIFKKYNFSERRINELLNGEAIYQLEVPYLNGSTRIIFERTDYSIAFLFLDVNHHIYMNKDKVGQSGSMFYNYCPVNINGECDRMNYLKTCFAFEFLDIKKYEATFNNSFSPPCL